MDSLFFITGSSRGIGKALAEVLLEESEQNQVIGLSRSNSLEHERFKHIEIDLSEDITDFARELFTRYKPRKKVVLVNNAGTLGDTAHVGDLDSQQLHKAFQVNVTAPAVLMNEFVRTYGAGEAAPLILNISSGAGKYPVDGWFGYCASKAALDMLSEVAAVEAEKSGSSLKVFAVAPGVVDTAMQEEIRQKSKQEFSGVEKFIQMKEEGALAPAREVAQKLLAFIQKPEQFEGVVQDVRNF
jgi:benzil reductase ((S)-benzoin forming)